MSRYAPMHARDGQRRDAIAAWWRRKAARGLTRLGGLCRFLPDRPAARLVLLALIALDRIDPTTPAPAAAPGQAQTAAPVAPPAGAAPGPALGRAPEADATTTPHNGGAAAPPRPESVAPCASPRPGPRSPGQPITWHRADGEDLVIGYGPECQIPRYRGDYRPTDGFPALQQEMRDTPVVPVYYQRYEARLDARAVSFR